MPLPNFVIDYCDGDHHIYAVVVCDYCESEYCSGCSADDDLTCPHCGAKRRQP